MQCQKISIYFDDYRLYLAWTLVSAKVELLLAIILLMSVKVKSNTTIAISFDNPYT